MNELVLLRKERVRDLIEQNDLKKWWVAEYAGVHKTTLRRWLNGRIDRVQQRHVEQLAVVLEVDARTLMAPAGPIALQGAPIQKVTILANPCPAKGSAS